MSPSEKQLVMSYKKQIRWSFSAEKFYRLPLATNPAVLNAHSTGTEAPDEGKWSWASLINVGNIFSRILAGFFLRLTDFIKFGGVFGGRIFFGGFSAACQNSADPDIRRRLGTLMWGLWVHLYPVTVRYHEQYIYIHILKQRCLWPNNYDLVGAR